ncbi:MAG: phytoene desaturase family protein [Jatrophihabitans sp.]|uniref:phytoene desaturase family protein n=1 Tax=Jatrophihabitans sp. TaxID=1932789 RepID=UPI003F80A79C
MRTVPGRTDRVVIVGAGLGGLSAALNLANTGRQVTLLEAADVPGGRAGILERDGYTFDTGPSVLTMPEIVADTFAAVGESMDDWLTLDRLDPAYRARFADGTSLDVHTDTEVMAETIRATSGAKDAEGYRQFVKYLRRLYDVEIDSFIDRNLDAPWQLLGRPALQLLRLGAFGRLAPRVARYVDDPRLQKLFSFQAMYAGLAPAEALAVYAVITYMDCVRGVFFPRGGMHALPRALASAAEKHGVEVRYGTRVSRIETSGGRAIAVHTAAGERVPADVVIVNADLPTAYRELLPPELAPRRLRRLRYSPSCVVLYAGVRKQYPDARHHTISFGRAWDSTFDEIIHDGRTMSDPSVLVSIGSKTDRSLAPDGADSCFVLFPTPHLQHDRPIDWQREAPRYRDHMVETLEQRGFEGFGSAIEVEHLVTPADWQAQGMAAGAPFAAAHLLRQSGPFRLPTLDRHVENLVFCGSNTQPGVGVPMVLLSGRLAAERVTGAVRRRVGG